jgi:hypothetical protein
MQTLEQFGQTIKQKYPQYNDMSDNELGQKMLAKYPQYQDMVSLQKPDSLLTSILKDPIKTLLVKPAVRTGQAIGAGLVNTFGTPQMKANLPGALSKDVSFMGMNIPAVKGFGAGGGKQIAGETLETAAYLAPYGTMARGATTGLKALGVGKKLAGGLGKVATGASVGYGFDVGSKLEQGKVDLTPGLATAIGGGIPTLAPVTKGVSRIVGESLGTLTGTGFGAIKEAWNAALTGGKRLEEFNQGLSGNANAESRCFGYDNQKQKQRL